MATIVKKAIRTDAAWAANQAAMEAEYGVGGYYTSLSAFESNLPADITLATGTDEIWIAECYDDWPSGLSDRVVCLGVTADHNNYVEFTVADGEWHEGDINAGFHLKSSSDSCFLPWFPGIRINKMRLEGGTATAINGVNNNSDFIAEKLIINGPLSSGGISASSNSKITLQTSLIYNCGGRGLVGAVGNTDLIARNVVVSKCSDIGILRFVTTNCVSVGHTLGDYWENGAGSDYNASEDTSSPGSNSIDSISPATEFVDAANNDFHLASGSSLDGAGIDLSSDFTTDIDGDTISAPWPIGFDYIVAAGGNFTITGDITKTKIANALLDFTGNQSIAGDITKTKISNALLSFSENNSIDGAITKTKTPNSLFEFNQNFVIAGDSTKTKTANALFDFTGNYLLSGDNTKTKIPVSNMVFTSLGNYVISGDITKTKIANSILSFTWNIDFTGSVTKTKTPLSGMAFVSQGNFVMTGDITKTKIANALLDFTGNHVLAGDNTKTKSSNSLLDFNQNFVIAGDSTKTKTANAVMLFESVSGGFTIAGDITKTKLSNALLNFTSNQSIAGSVTKTKTPISVLLGPGSGDHLIDGIVTKTKTPFSVLKFTGSDECFILEETINKLLRDTVNAILAIPDYSIRSKQQDAPRPRGSYAVVDFISDTGIGWEQYEYSDRIDNNVDSTVRGMREIMMSIGFYREGAIDNARRVRTGLLRNSVQSLFNQAKIGLIRRNPVVHIATTFENGWEERAQLDVFLSVVGCDEDVINSICSVDIAGEYQERKIKHNFNIGVQI